MGITVLLDLVHSHAVKNTAEGIKAEEALIADINDQISKQKVEIERIEQLLVDEQAKLDQVETER